MVETYNTHTIKSLQCNVFQTIKPTNSATVQWAHVPVSIKEGQGSAESWSGDAELNGFGNNLPP